MYLFCSTSVLVIFLAYSFKFFLCVHRLIEEDEDEELENEMATATPKGLKRLELSKTLKLGLHTKEILPKAVIEDL